MSHVTHTRHDLKLGARSGRDAACNVVVDGAGQHKPIVVVRVLAYHDCMYVCMRVRIQSHVYACTQYIQRMYVRKKRKKRKTPAVAHGAVLACVVAVIAEILVVAVVTVTATAAGIMRCNHDKTKALLRWHSDNQFVCKMCKSNENTDQINAPGCHANNFRFGAETFLEVLHSSFHHRACGHESLCSSQ